jgi:hypothetical protein
MRRNLHPDLPSPLVAAAACLLIAITPSLMAQAPGTTQAQPAVAAPSAIQTITADDLKAHATTLASPEFEGRLTTTPGQIKAAEYFVKRFEELGLKPWGNKKTDKRSWYHTWPARVTKLEEQGTGLFDARKKRVTNYGAWLLPRSKSDKQEVKGHLVFLGRGENEEHKVPGAIAVLVYDVEGGGSTDIQRAIGDSFKVRAEINGLANKARRAEAKACVVIMKRMPASLLSNANMGLPYPGKPMVSYGEEEGPGMMAMMGGTPPRLPTLVVSADDASAVLAALGVPESAGWDEENDLAIGKKSKESYTLLATRASESVDALNVCAVLEGRDPQLKSEAILYSCHMDHLGRAADGSIFLGADDNASGSATVLEIAEAYAKLEGDDRPRRSIVFLVVSGEELGLFGSAHYAKEPTWPLNKIAGNVNMDMLGRSTNRVPPDTVAVTPTKRNEEFNTLARRAYELGEQFGLKMGDGDRFYERSDHYNFAQRGIPVVFFCDDEHADYHMTTDSADKLEFDKMERIARLAFLIGYTAANDDSRPSHLGRQNQKKGQ